jgi:hypothetical protein
MEWATISQLKDYIKCPQYAEFIHDLRRVPSKTPPYFDEGSIFHEAMENKLHGRNPDILQSASWMEAGDEARDRFFRKHRLDVAIDYYEIDPDWSVEAVEIPLYGTFGRVKVVGRLDAIVKYNNKYWSLQWKTYSKDILRLIEQVRLGWHEAAYQDLARQNAYLPWGGTILGACQKLPSYRVTDGKRIDITDEQRVETFTTHYLARNESEQSELIKNLITYLNNMQEGWGLGTRNYESCWGPNKDFKCPYYDVCHGGQSIESEDFKTAAPRYQPVP